MKQGRTRQQIEVFAITFMVDFTESDLAGLSNQEWKKLKGRLEGFFEVAGGFRNTSSERLPDRYPRKKILALQADVSQLLKGLVATREEDVTYRTARPRAILAPRHVSTTRISVDYEQYQYGDQSWFEVNGQPRDLFLATLIRLWSSKSADRIRMCQCGRLFVRQRRQEYCANAECQEVRKREYWQTYIKSPKGKEARKRQYEAGGWNLGGRPKKAASKRKAEGK